VKSITLSADEHLIESAEERARARDTTLNEEFQRWLAEYTQSNADLNARRERYDAVMNELRGKLRVGRKLTREEMTER
jgi:hypothetical protein